MPRKQDEFDRADRIRLLHMLEAADRVARFSDGFTCESLEADEMRFLAVVKSIETIGEAATKVSEETRSRMSAIDWIGLRRMRNRLIHGYDTIDPARVWDAVEVDVAALIPLLQTELGESL